MKTTIKIELTTGSIITAELSGNGETVFIADALKKAISEAGAEIADMSVIEANDITHRYFKK